MTERSLEAILSAAWERRTDLALWEKSQALRVFHGPGEGQGLLDSFSIDRFGDQYWVTEWQSQSHAGDPLPFSEGGRAAIRRFLEQKGAQAGVLLERPLQGLPPLPMVLLGQPTEERFAVQEGVARYWIQLLGARHPGLFLDHLPLREWLSQHSRGLNCLNTFAYTGSLSIASAHGGASHVTTLDISKATIDWARANWSLNGFSEERGRFISGDVFEWLPRLKRQGERYDCVILDPPSFSRGKKGNFSTARDLSRLHELALELLTSRGVLVTSINSASIPWKRFEADIGDALRRTGKAAKELKRLSLPETFPTLPGPSHEVDRYLKGLIYQVSSLADR